MFKTQSKHTSTNNSQCSPNGKKYTIAVVDPTQPNLTHGSTQPMDNSDVDRSPLDRSRGLLGRDRLTVWIAVIVYTVNWPDCDCPSVRLCVCLSHSRFVRHRW